MQYPEDMATSVDAFLSALSSRTVEHFLDCNELIVIDNHRWAHGRTAFLGANSSVRLIRRAYSEVCRDT
jgi:hypothetical protein